MEQTMWMIVIALLCSFCSIYGANVNRTAPEVVECNKKNHDHQVTLVEAIGMVGNATMYPLRKKEKGVLELKIKNTGRLVETVRPSLKIWKRVSILGYKKWMPIPTFGYLDKQLNKCHLCPLRSGITVTALPLSKRHLDKLGRHLAGEYQVVMTIYDAKNKTDELLCASIEFEFAE